MNRNTLMVVAVVVVVALALWLPGFLGRRAQLVKVFEAFEALEPGKEASAGGVLHEHKLLTATQEIQRMEELSPGFAETPVGANLRAALAALQLKLDGSEVVSDKENYLRFSEIEFDHPTEEDWNQFQKLKAAGKQDEKEFLYLLQPRTTPEKIHAACRVRAAGLLKNAQILAGRASGELYVPPEPRKEHMWLDSLPVMHPGRNR